VPGKVRFEYRHYPIIGPESLAAAMAAECAADQGKFWEYHDKVFANQAGENRGAFTKEKLQQFGQEIGLDMGPFNSCLDAGANQAGIVQAARDGQQAGVRGTPAFFLVETGQPLSSGQKFDGVLTFDQFKTIIDQALAGR
jgi:protein-disulfide isomerase